LHLALGDLALPLARLSSFILHPSRWGGYGVPIGWLSTRFGVALLSH
jgi:hypothetical protein